jgi:hypothetical protein
MCVHFKTSFDNDDDEAYAIILSTPNYIMWCDGGQCDPVAKPKIGLLNAEMGI